MTNEFPIRKTVMGFAQDGESMELTWDQNGKYLGQWQDDMISDPPDAVRMFLDKCDESVADLTEDEMQQAKKETQ